MRSVMFAVLVLMSALIAPVQAQQTPGYSTITIDELARMLEHEDFSLVNVHVPYEGELPQTDAFIQFDQIAENLDKLPAAKDAKIVLYCRSGRMSEIAGATLAGLGYTNVLHVDGGFDAWSMAGRDLLQH
jgi:rhodanese-related sulfurtransferase